MPYYPAQSITAIGSDGTCYTIEEAEGFAESSMDRFRRCAVGAVVCLAPDTYEIWRMEDCNSTKAIAIARPYTSITDPYAAAIIADLLALLREEDALILEEARDYLAAARMEHPRLLQQLLRSALSH